MCVCKYTYIHVRTFIHSFMRSFIPSIRSFIHPFHSISCHVMPFHSCRYEHKVKNVNRRMKTKFETSSQCVHVLLCMYMYVYIYMCVCVYVYIRIYIYTCMTESLNKAWRTLLSPPRERWPQVTTVPSAKIAAKAPFVAWTSRTFRSRCSTDLLSPP